MSELSGLARPVTDPTTSALSAEFVGKHSSRPSAVRPTAFRLLIRALRPFPVLLTQLRAASASVPPSSRAMAPAMAARWMMDLVLPLIRMVLLLWRTGVAPPSSAPVPTRRAAGVDGRGGPASRCDAFAARGVRNAVRRLGRFGYEEPALERARPSTPERSVSFELALPIADSAPTSFAHPSGCAKYSTRPAAIST